MKEVDPIIFHATHKYKLEAWFVHTPENEIGYAVYITLHKHTVGTLRRYLPHVDWL